MELVELGNRIEIVNAQLQEMQAYYLANRHELAVDLEITSLKVHLEELEREWAQSANRLGKDVCTYYIWSDDNNRPSIQAVSEMLLAFQKSFTAVYDGIKNGPKDRANISSYVRDRTKFDFGYTSPGSLKVTFTVQHEQLQFWSDTSVAIDLIHKMTRVDTESDIFYYADKYGRSAVFSVYDWVQSHLRYDYGIHVSWKPQGVEQDRDFQIYQPDLEHFTSLIERTSEASVSELSVVGSLRGWDADKRSFRLVADQRGKEYVGVIASTFDTSDSVSVPGMYRIDLTQTICEEIALNKVTETYELTDLEILASMIPDID